MTQVDTPQITETAELQTRSIAIAIPMHTDPDWEILAELPEDIPLIIIDDSDGNLAEPPRGNVRMFDYAAQRDYLGEHYDAIPHRSAATRNFGHVVAYREGYDVVVALDYDCRPRPGWLDEHLRWLGPVDDAPALVGEWVNTVAQPGFYARGYPYEFRNPDDATLRDTTVTGEVKLNMGVWDNVLDLNGVDKWQAEVPSDPGSYGDVNPVAQGMIPLCGMNTAFSADLVPAYDFLPDVWVNGDWQLSRHDDIWGGYVLQRLMAVRGDLVRFGGPVVEHTRQSELTRVCVMEQYMHLMSMPFYRLVDEAVEQVQAGDYAQMFGAFTEAYLAAVTRSGVPRHYREVFTELGEHMSRWAAIFA